jgi:hypothetical protein
MDAIGVESAEFDAEVARLSALGRTGVYIAVGGRIAGVAAIRQMF